MTLGPVTLFPLLPWWALLAVLGAPLALAAAGLWTASRPGAIGGSRAAWWRRAAAVLVLCLIGLGPSVAQPRQDTQEANVDMFFVVDRTGSMAAEDYNGTHERLDGVRHDIRSLTQDIPAARYSIISFDSQAARQLPLTTDARAVDSWTQTFRREITRFSQGSLTDRPLAELTRALKGAREQRPANSRVVFFLSDGEQTAPGKPRSFAALAPLIDAGAVLGYGTAAGGRMKGYAPDVDAAKDPYLKDPERPDADARSRIDEDKLRTLADQLGVPYVHRTAPTATAPLVAGVDPRLIAADGRRQTTTYRYVVWPLGLVLAALLAAEAWGWATTTGSSLPARRGRRRTELVGARGGTVLP